MENTETPSINDIRAAGYEVVLLDSGYRSSGTGVTGVGDLRMDSIWEDRLIWEHVRDYDLEFGEYTTADIARPITVEKVDDIIESGTPTYVSLDKVSPNDPRFFQPEDRNSLGLRPDLKLMGLFYESDEAFQTALLGFSTAASSGAATLALAGGAFQGFLNEKKIRHQDKLLPSHLKTMELSGVLHRRKQSKKKYKKGLREPVTVNEVIKLYKANQLQTMTKDTAIAGASSTVSLTGSTLALAMLFPPLFPAFSGTSAAIAGAGAIATSLASVGNRRRLIKAIDKAFEQPEIKKALEKRVEAMNQELSNAASTSGDIDKFLTNTTAERKTAERLMAASTALLATSLVTRGSGMAKHVMPMIGTIAMGAGASITSALVAISGVMNFRERRSKLHSLSQTSSEILKPEYGKKQKRKLCLFGDTAFQRYLRKNMTEVLSDLKLPGNTSIKKLSLYFSLEDNKQHLEKYLRRFARDKWLRDLGKYASKQKLSWDEIRKDPQTREAFLKDYLIKRVGDYAHNNTWPEGRSGTLKLALVGAFSGIFFLPMLGVAAGTLGIGLGITKGIAVHERKLFKQELTKLFETPPPHDPEKKAIHNSLKAMVSSWSKMLTSTDNDRDQNHSHSLTE